MNEPTHESKPKTYREKVTAIADGLGISNEDGLKEEDLNVQAITFILKDGSEVNIPGTDMNRAGRLYFMHLAKQNGWNANSNDFSLTEEIKEAAAKHFADMWDTAESAGRTMLKAFKAAEKVKPDWKEENQR